MNGIKEWVKKISEDKNFAKKFEGKSANEVSVIAKKEGFNFKPEEYMDLKMEAAAGGEGFWDNVKSRFNGAVKGAKDSAMGGEEKEDGIYMVKDGVEYFTTTPKDNDSWKPTGKTYRKPGSGFDFGSMF